MPNFNFFINIFTRITDEMTHLKQAIGLEPEIYLWIIIFSAGLIAIFAILLFFILFRLKKNTDVLRPVHQMAGKKTATILSGSFVPLHNRADTMPERDFFDLLNDYAKEAESAAKKTGGVFAEIPDGSIMAHWGIETTSGNAAHDALNAVRAALMLRMNLLELKKVRFVKGCSVFYPVCGLSTGKIINDDPAQGKNTVRHLIGESTVLAAKAREGAAKHGLDIVITTKTWRLISQYVIAEEIESAIDEDGKATALFAIVNLRAQTGMEQPWPQTLKELKILLKTGNFDNK
ncbi:MAG: hypothetical protein LBV68_05895 [Spirochaetaceae bacterium]|nr:hypothetical protein [Spirochaetaceae bacterium]